MSVTLSTSTANVSLNALIQIKDKEDIKNSFHIQIKEHSAPTILSVISVTKSLAFK